VKAQTNERNWGRNRGIWVKIMRFIIKWGGFGIVRKREKIMRVLEWSMREKGGKLSQVDWDLFPRRDLIAIV